MADLNDVLKLLRKKLQEVEQQHNKLKRAIAALEDEQAGAVDQVVKTMVRPPIIDICHFLEGHGSEPVHQREIINAVGTDRQRRYPSLSNPWSNVWRALEYHVRHRKLISCVNPATRRAVELKPLPPRPPGNQKLSAKPSLYEADNWFLMAEAVVEEHPDLDSPTARAASSS